MRTNRGLVPDAADSGPTRPVVLVQAKDAEGFWCNVYEPPAGRHAQSHAMAYAQAWANLHRQSTRVVKGEKRDVVREFYAAAEDFSPVTQGFDAKARRA